MSYIKHLLESSHRVTFFADTLLIFCFCIHSWVWHIEAPNPYF